MTEAMPSDAIVERLNEVLAEEVEAVIRYLHLALSVKGLDRLLVQDELFEGMQETLEHARKVAEHMVQMGVAPRIRLSVDLQGQKISGEEAIRTALAVEEEALDAYRELLDQIEDNIPLEEFIRAQIAVENEHVSNLRLLLE